MKGKYIHPAKSEIARKRRENMRETARFLAGVSEEPQNKILTPKEIIAEEMRVLIDETLNML